MHASHPSASHSHQGMIIFPRYLADHKINYIFCQGVPSFEVSLKRLIKSKKKESDHVPAGVSFLTPVNISSCFREYILVLISRVLCQVELVDIREHLLNSSESFVNRLQMYSLILIGTRLFLRQDEVAGLGFHSIVPEVSVIKNNTLVQLGLKVTGKTEKGEYFTVLLLHRDDNFPALCPIRHLLLLIALTGVQSGYFFGHNPYNSSIPVSFAKLNNW